MSTKTVRKWRDRFVAEGNEGLLDRSSRPHRSPNGADRVELECCGCVGNVARGADRIAFEVGIASSTVQRIFRAGGVWSSRSRRSATDTSPVTRYQRERPGELIHVDVKRSRRSPRAADGKSTATTLDPRGQVSVTATSTPPSMTALASSTPRSSTTNKAPPQRCSPAARHGVVRVDRDYL